MSPNTREQIQYCTAIAMVVSGMILAFLSFFLNGYDIANGTLLYIAQALTYAGGIFGVSLYFKSKAVELKSETSAQKEDVVNTIIQYLWEKIENKVNTNNNGTKS